MDFNLNLKGMLIGLIVSMAFLVVHELLHAMCFPRELNLFNKKIQYKLILDFYLMKIKRLFVISFSKL